MRRRCAVRTVMPVRSSPGHWHRRRDMRSSACTRPFVAGDRSCSLWQRGHPPCRRRSPTPVPIDADSPPRPHRPPRLVRLRRSPCRDGGRPRATAAPADHAARGRCQRKGEPRAGIGAGSGRAAEGGRERAAKLAAEIDAIGQDRRKLARALIETATRLREVEERASPRRRRGSRRWATTNARIRAAAGGAPRVIAELLAALQRIGRRPPPALMVRPEDALDSVRTAIMLGAVVPEMRVEIETLAADLPSSCVYGANRRGARRPDARSRQSFGGTPAHDAAGRRTAEAPDGNREGARLRAAAGRVARPAGRQSQGSDRQARAGCSRRQPVRLRRRRIAGAAAGRNFAVLRDAPRLAPAIAFASAKGALPLPVNGVKVKDFGAADKLRRQRERVIDRHAAPVRR